MKLSEKQAIALLQIAMDSLESVSSHYKYKKEDRMKLVEQIMGQQSDIIDVIQK